jgi:hypothetical protein
MHHEKKATSDNDQVRHFTLTTQTTNTYNAFQAGVKKSKNDNHLLQTANKLKTTSNKKSNNQMNIQTHKHTNTQATNKQTNKQTTSKQTTSKQTHTGDSSEVKATLSQTGQTLHLLTQTNIKPMQRIPHRRVRRGSRDRRAGR